MLFVTKKSCKAFSENSYSVLVDAGHSLEDLFHWQVVRDALNKCFNYTFTLKYKEYLNIHILKDRFCSFPSFRIISSTTLFPLSHLVPYVELKGKKGHLWRGCSHDSFSSFPSSMTEISEIKAILCSTRFFCRFAIWTAQITLI